MVLLVISSIILIWSNFVRTFDNEDFFTLLCGADEEHMEDLYDNCEAIMRDAVDGCMQKCFIEIRNSRAPTTRIDEKYYQFVMCDTAIWQGCVTPCIEALQVSYDGFGNIADWSNCMTETVRKMEDEIERQDDRPKKRKRKNKGKGSKKRPPPKKNGKNGKGNSNSRNSNTLKLRLST